MPDPSTIAALTDPATGLTLGDLGMVVSVSESEVVIQLPTAAYPAVDDLKATVAAAAPDATISITSAKPNGIAAIVAVGSGKGGVGKSTVAATLALALREMGAKVGLLDADVYGPSIPHMLGVSGRPAVMQVPNGAGGVGEQLVPLEAIAPCGEAVKLISMGFMVEPDQAVVWRGPMLHRALTQFIQQTAWGDLDYLIVDMPPGTGDVALTLSQQAALAGAVVVCTPQKVALLDAGKAISMYGQVKIPVLGVVENMSGEVFGRGGAKAKAEAMGVPFIGELESIATICRTADEGNIKALLESDSEVREPIMAIAGNVVVEALRATAAKVELPGLGG